VYLLHVQVHCTTGVGTTRRDGDWQGTTQVLGEKPVSSACLGLNPGLRCEKLVTDSLSETLTFSPDFVIERAGVLHLAGEGAGVSVNPS
jgi:hypothetical protein